MDRREILARCAVFLIVIGFPVGVLAYHQGYRPSPPADVRVIDLIARSPESGGWQPESIALNRGDTVRLRITALDVVHGFAIGQTDIDVGRILPGETAEVEFVADRAGRFTYYCNVWCSPFHYRMRGTLEVIDPQAPPEPSADDASLNVAALDLDTPHEAEFYPLVRPSAARGAAIYHRTFGSARPDRQLLNALRLQSPSELFQSISEGHYPAKTPSADVALTPEETWDVVAYLWSLTTTPERMAVGRALYAKNCAACHGETGTGDGPGGQYGDRPSTDFTYPRTMAGGTSEIYLAKTRRGGMGTGMPYWGPIFTDEELVSIVDYLWSFLFSYDGTSASP